MPFLFYPLESLWTCAANDEGLSKLLESAIYHGAFLLITNIELASASHATLLHKIHSIRTFSSLSKGVHPLFRLFISTAVSINWAFQHSESIFPVQLEEFSITDLSLTDNCLNERLESIVLAQERSEFETQRRLMEADRFHLEEQMEHLHLDLLDTVSSSCFFKIF